jgi:hypothetical protein
MKHWGTRRTMEVASVTAVLVLAVAATWLLVKPPTHDCTVEHSTDSYQIRPVKVIIRPWLGQHQVFGIFMIPIHYRSGRTYSGTISVGNFISEFIPDSQPQFQQIEDVVALPKYYLVRGYIPTRIALWFLLSGGFGDLRTPCHWMLEFVKRIP